jgi:glycine/D-amino acid oxidase-like deaminating enzyme
MISNTISGSRKVNIIGSGIVGLCCALYLQRDGWEVTIIDKVGPGESCSYGHAGVLSETSALPNAMPGVISKVPKWLLDPEGPLYIRMRYLPHLLPWLLRFIKAGTARESENTVRSLLALNAGTVGKYQNLVNSSQAGSLIRPSGYLSVYQSESSYKHASGGWELLQRHGAQLRMLTGEELHELEPMLAPSYIRAVMIENQGYVTNPYRLAQVLSEQFSQAGGVFLRREVREARLSADGNVRLNLDLGYVESGKLVVAAGAWSHQITAQLGVHVPLETERGYHVTLAHPEVQPSHVIMEAEHKFVATPMEMGIRFAGTAELAGLTASPNYERADILLRLGKRMFPGLSGSEKTEWMGHRPSLPDSRPVIGKCPAAPNVLFAFGHGHRGLIGAPMTGEIIADLMANRQPKIDITPFSPERF